MKRVPNFYRRNAAAGAVRRVLDKKRADPEEARETVEQIVSLCVAMAAVSVMEWNEGQRDEYLRCANCCIEDYNIKSGRRADSRRCVRYRPTFTLWKSSLWMATRSGAPTSPPTCI